MKSVAAIAALLTVASALMPAVAADRTETVRFARGATSATLKGKVRGYDGVKYHVGASAGQAISVLFSPRNSACYFNVSEPGANAAVFNGSTSGNEYSANLTKSGNYVIQVYLMRSAARRNEVCRYDMTIEIAGPGARTAAPAPSVDVKVPGTNFHATGVVPCARDAGQPMAQCKFGVVREGGGKAQVTIFWPGGGNRVISYEQGTPSAFDRSQADGDVQMQVRKNVDLFTITIGNQRFEIPEAVFVGG